MTAIARLTIVLAMLFFSINSASAAPEPAWGSIELLRDKWGTPHVFAASDEGAMYGLGWATAEDRGFQMTWSLRIIQGRSAEALGDRPKAGGKETTVQSDRKMRTFGFYRAALETARRLDRPTLGLLEAYSRGVNDSFAARGQAGRELFDAFGLAPEPWTPADCLASWWHLGQFFATDGTRDLIHWHTLQSGGQAAALARASGGARGEGRGARKEGSGARDQGSGTGRDAAGRRGSATRTAPSTPSTSSTLSFPSTPPDDAAAVIQRADVSEEWLKKVNAFAREHGLGRADEAVRDPSPKFSHAWVVGGKLTGGGAVLMSDPQTPVANPSLFYEFHVQGKTFNARGIGVPGSPALLIGWTETIAWGLTALGADQADLFMLQTDREHPDQYRLDGAWKPMEVVEETIRVKGGPAQKMKVSWTRFGPIISEFAFPSPGDPPVALKRIPVCEPERETIQGAFGMMRAGTIDEFARALEGWRFPSANIVFGDRSGAIGFRLLGAFSLRAPGSPDAGGAAIDGSTARNDWRGFIPYDLVPHALNPARGWVASANHRPIASFYPLPLGLSTGGGGDTVRSWRLRELLAGKDKFTPRDVLRIQEDDVNPARRELARLGLHLAGALGRPLNAEARAALEALRPWLAGGAHSDLATPGAVVAQNINTMFRMMQTELALKYGGGESGLAKFLKEAQAKIERDPQAALGPEVEEYVTGVLEQAWTAARAQFGADSAKWPARARAAARRSLAYGQSLDGFGGLDPARDLQVPPLACVDGGTIKSQGAQAYSQWVPLGAVDEALTLLPPGAAEKPGGPGWLAGVEAWSRGELHPAPITRAAVERLTVSRAVLSVP